MKTVSSRFCLALVCVFYILAGIPLAMSFADDSEEQQKTVSNNIPEWYEDLIHSPLKPADTSSPQATLLSFIQNMNRSYQLLMTAHQENLASSGWATPPKIAQKARRAAQLMSKAIYCLDMSQVARLQKESSGYESAILLKEILDRISLPDISSIPGVEDPKWENENEEKDGIDRWRIPETRITISEISEGPRKGEFLFAPETVARLEDYYRRVKNLPYNTERFTTDDFLDFYISTPGTLLPPKWIKWVPDWMNTLLLDQTLWQWAALFIFPALAFFLLSSSVRFWYRKGSEVLHIHRYVGWGFLLLMVPSIARLVTLLLDKYVNLTGKVLYYTENTLQPILITLFFGVIIYEYLRDKISLQNEQENETDSADEEMGAGGSRGETLLILLKKAVMSIIVTVVFLLLLSSMGINIAPLLAGAGVVGLAVGFGAQTLVRDIFSGVFFLLDDAFRVGDYIETGSLRGTVYRISIRSVTLRHHRGMMITIPFGDMQSVVNYSRDYVIMKLDIRVPFDTDIDKVRKVIKRININIQEDEMFNSGLLDKIKSQGVRDLDDSAMIIRVKFKCVPGKQFILRREVYRRIQEAFQQQNIAFAHRNVTVYFPQDENGATPSPESTSGPSVSEPKLEAAAAAALRSLDKEKQSSTKRDEL